MHQAIKAVAVLLFLGGCGNPFDEILSGRQVKDDNPVYCYQSLADVQCYGEPKYVDKNRIVNFYGPHPSRFGVPKPVIVPELKAPKPIERWVKDPEPIPQPAVKTGNL